MRSTWTRVSLPAPTVVFDSFWRFAAERQKVFLSRLAGAPPPFTEDAVLREFKFTNAYRASDRTSQYLIRRVIYDAERPWSATFSRIVLFKLFNRLETWEYLQSQLGDELEDPAGCLGALEHALTSAKRAGHTLYSAAYIMPSATTFGSAHKHVNHIRLLGEMVNDHAHLRIAEAGSMKAVFEVLTAYPSIGGFLGYQLATDLNYSHHLSFGEDEFVSAGPGALDGVAKCFDDLGDLSAEDIITWTYDTQEEQFAARGVCFDDLWGRPLQLIDCQNLFCEISKYSRAAYPQVKGNSRRNRIKQRFTPRADGLTAWYPPKWGLNEKVKGWLREQDTEMSADYVPGLIVDLRPTEDGQQIFFLRGK